MISLPRYVYVRCCRDPISISLITPGWSSQYRASWGVPILQLDESLVDESHHIVYGWPVSGEGLSRRSAIGRRCTNQSKRKQAPDSR
jgi:hypothetical protein